MTNEELIAFLHMILPQDGGSSYDRFEQGSQRWTYWGKFDTKYTEGHWFFAPYPVNNWGPELTADEAHAQLVEVLNRDQ